MTVQVTICPIVLHYAKRFLHKRSPHSERDITIVKVYRAYRHLNCRYLVLRNTELTQHIPKTARPCGLESYFLGKTARPCGFESYSQHSFELLLDSLHTACLHFAKTGMDVLMQLEDAHIKYAVPMLLERVRK